MELPELFDLIRKEPVCLFIGSGFSLYAGMPSANKLIETLRDDLTINQQKKIELSVDLRNFTEDYQVLFGRRKLIKVIQKSFGIVPQKAHLHQLLAKIPYFNSIITTNYDRLIEDWMGNNAAVLIKDTDVYISRQKRCRIFKIHGDVGDSNSIVITNTDYSQHYNRNFKDPFWASVIAEISSKNVIFLGYGFEDDNVWADFNHIDKKLQSKVKKCILISPGANTTKQKKLKQQRIDYIQADGETFLNGLVADLKLNIVADHRQGIVNTQTAQEFITAFDMKVSITANIDTASITEISRVGGPTHQIIKFTTTNQDLFESYKEFTNGYHIQDFKIMQEQLESCTYLIENFNFLSKNEIYHLNLSHIADYNGICTVHFHEFRFTLFQVNYRLFNSIPGHVRIEVEVSGFKAEYYLKVTDGKAEVNFKMIEPDQPASVNKIYEVMRAFYLFFSGQKAEIVTDTGIIIHKQLTPHIQAKEFKAEMEIFDSLKKIGNYFAIVFSPLSLSALWDDERYKIKKLTDLIDHGYHAVKENDGILIDQIPDSQKLFDELKSAAIPNNSISLVTHSGRELELFGHIIKLGNEQISMKQPTVTIDYDNLRAQFIPADHVLVYRYERFGHLKLQDSQTLWDALEKNRT